VKRTMTRLLAFLSLTLMLPACQQKMADAPYYRPYDETPFFKDRQSARPIPDGAINRNQRVGNDPLMSGLTEVGFTTYQTRERLPTEGDPAENKRWVMEQSNYRDTFPFVMTQSELRRGMERYTAFCVECHGVLGNGAGKIVERGYLRPPSYHTVQLQENEPSETLEELRGHPRGYSRGFARWQQKVPLDTVPVGYIFEVISKGYGGMPEHASQIPAADRWRIAAYVRALQFSQNVPLDQMPAEVKAEIEKAAAAKKSEGQHE